MSGEVSIHFIWEKVGVYMMLGILVVVSVTATVVLYAGDDTMNCKLAFLGSGDSIQNRIRFSRCGWLRKINLLLLTNE